VVTGLLLDESGLQEITTRLKRLCGAGGAVKEGTIEIQGEHRETIMVELKKQGYKVK
jgi:translation initiation factor 1